MSMAQFQRDFFLLRQADWESYKFSLKNRFIIQGDLTNKDYFEFISYVQFIEINRALSAPETLIEEEVVVDVEAEPQTFKTVVKRRPAQYSDDESLAQAFLNLQGDFLLDNFENFAVKEFKSVSEAVDGVKLLAVYSAGCGFAAVEFTTPTLIVFTNPANLWCLTALRQNKPRKQTQIVEADYFFIAAQALLNRSPSIRNLVSISKGVITNLEISYSIKMNN